MQQKYKVHFANRGILNNLEGFLIISRSITVLVHAGLQF